MSAEETSFLVESNWPLAARLGSRLGSHWPFVRGRTRILEIVRHSLRYSKPYVRTSLQHSSVQLIVPWSDLGGASLVVFQEQEPEVFSFLSTAFEVLDAKVRALSTFVDVGANFGAFALRLPALFSIHCVAFEPHAALAQLLEYNVNQNHLSQLVTICAVALGSERKTAHMFHCAENAGNSKIILTDDGFPVAMSRLDDYFTPEKWKHVPVVKLDVEGFEIEVLRGAAHLLEHHRPTLVLEINLEELRQRALTAKDVTALLRSLGYREFYCLDRCLYPLENGIRKVSNIVAIGFGGDTLLEAYGFQPSFLPKGTKFSPILSVDFA